GVRDPGRARRHPGRRGGHGGGPGPGPLRLRTRLHGEPPGLGGGAPGGRPHRGAHRDPGHPPGCPGTAGGGAAGTLIRVPMPPKTQKLMSCGVVVLRETPEGWRLLMLRIFRHWDFPKGLMEAGEEPLVTALREVREESTV